MPEAQHKNFVMTETKAGNKFKDFISRLLGVLPGDGFKPMLESDHEKIYHEPSSFTQYLPFKDYDEEGKVFLFDDGISVGAVFDIKPVDIEGQSDDVIEKIELGIQSALQRLPGDREHPLVVQIYLNDEPITDLVDILRDYATDSAKETKHHEMWMDEIGQHIKHLAKDGGLFEDTVSDMAWNGQYRKVRCVIYKNCAESEYFTKSGKPIKGRGTPTLDLNDAIDSFVSALKQIGLTAKRYEPRDLYNWLLPWFSPNPDSFDSVQDYLKVRPFPDDSLLGTGLDLSEMLFTGYPSSDDAVGTWSFHDMPHRLISLQAMDSPPKTGILTAEIKTHAGSKASMWDSLPKGSTFVTTIIVTPQTVVKAQCEGIIDAAGQGSPEAIHAADQANAAIENVVVGNYLFPVFSGIYMRGADDNDLAMKVRKAITILNAAGFNPIEPKYDPTGIDSYLRHLPMAFNYHIDKKQGHSTRLTYVNHIACILPFYGRGTGTGNPGNLYYNRIGELFLFDPVKDKTRVAHSLIFGPTGAGKSALINYMVLHDMAMLKPRLFIIEKGNSFGLTADYFASTGLSVNKVTFKVQSDISLPPYAKAFEALKQAEENDFAMERALDQSVDDQFTSDGDLVDEDEDGRDYMGEMELLTRLMITDADPINERDITQPDKLVIRTAILNATREARDKGIEHVIITDVVRQLEKLSRRESISEKRKEKITHLAESLELWTEGLQGRFFNRPGKQWPECDVTVLDMGILASGDYSAMLAVAIVSLINTITDIGERNQYSGRETHVYTDEGHVITTNPTLVKPFVFGAKTWRKLNIWLKQGTQQVEDYPDEAKKMLGLAEWWYLLVMDKADLKELERFKTFTDEEKHLITSARKESKKYTEGVIISPNLKSLFRVVMPALPLVLAGTDGDEKTARRKIMDEQGISEIDACFYIADQIKKARS